MSANSSKVPCPTFHKNVYFLHKKNCVCARKYAPIYYVIRGVGVAADHRIGKFTCRRTQIP